MSPDRRPTWDTYAFSQPSAEDRPLVHPQPAIVEGELAAEPGPIRLVRLRLTLALIAMAFLPIAITAPILSTALDSQRAIEQTQADGDAAAVAEKLTARLDAFSTVLLKTAAVDAVAAYAGNSRNAQIEAKAKAAILTLSAEADDKSVVATLLDTRGRQLLRAVGGRLAQTGPTTAVDPLVGAALDAGRGRVESDLVRANGAGATRLALATPVLRGATMATAVGIVRVELSLDRVLELAGRGRIAGGVARLIDPTGATVAPAVPASTDSGPTIGATSELAWHDGWIVRLVAPTRLAPPPLVLIGLLALSVIVLGILVAWMARQVLRPAEELEASRGRLRDMYDLARGDSLRDVLTGLGNHRAFQEAIQRQFDAAKGRGAPLGLVLIDLDDFQAVNEAGGHAAGDQALAEFGRVVVASMRTGDRAFRTGGDEFALLLPGATAEAAAAVARRLLAVWVDHRPDRGPAVTRSFSAGTSACPALASDRRQLLDQADAALSWAKRHGRTSVETFDPTRHRKARAASVAEEPSVGVAEVIARRLLRPVYQPIIDLRSGRVVGSEGLIRPAPGSGFSNPGELFDAAEAAGRTVELDLACVEIVAAGAASTMTGESVLTLNLSPRTLEADDFSAGALVALVRRAGLDPGRIVLELTEREQIEEMERLRRNVAACRGAGFRLAADDVGAGNAGLRLLSQLQFDIVKIDLSLVQGGAVHEASKSVVGALQDLARRWGASVIAEGIETPEQLRIVRELEIAAGQGYLLGRPMTADDLVALQATGVDIEGIVEKDDWLRRIARSGTGLAAPASLH
ncbi:MAG: bifunctional diguanylate cyclase/phosphodiesterase [Chloroflexota bacterium]